MMEFETGLKTVTSIFTCFKVALEITDGIKSFDKKEKILDLKKNISDLKEAFLNIIQENQELKNSLKAKSETYFEKGVFFHKILIVMHFIYSLRVHVMFYLHYSKSIAHRLIN